MVFSDVIKDQTALAWQYLEKAKPLITYKKLVPVSEAQIAQYEITWNKIVPPDLRYWLTTYGSGRIEFLEGELEILSIYELMNSDGRDVSVGDPHNCWKRIYIGYAGAPVTLCLDSTIIDENGCAPIILTEKYSNKVEQVLASSWPMFVVKGIIDIALALKNRHQNESFTAEQVSAIDELTSWSIEVIDVALRKASERAVAHNKTKIEESDGPIDNTEMVNSMLDILGKCHDKMESRKLIPTLLSNISGLYSKNDKFTKKVMEIEAQIEKGYASLSFDLDYFFNYEVEPRHAEGLQTLLDHDRRELRKLAELGWLRINPGDADK